MSLTLAVKSNMMCQSIGRHCPEIAASRKRSLSNPTTWRAELLSTPRCWMRSLRPPPLFATLFVLLPRCDYSMAAGACLHWLPLPFCLHVAQGRCIAVSSMYSSLSAYEVRGICKIICQGSYRPFQNPATHISYTSSAVWDTLHSPRQYISQARHATWLRCFPSLAPPDPDVSSQH